MKKAKALIIAPYEGLKDLALNIGKSRDDIDVECFVGDLEDGTALVYSVQNIGYDFIISRGGTAKSIREIANIPVIEVKLSEYDMMRAVKLAQNCGGKFAIVGFSNITVVADLIFDILNYKVDIFTINGNEDSLESAKKIKKLGYTMIIGDVVAVNGAKKEGLNTILLTSGYKSVENAFDEAIRLYNEVEKIKSQTLNNLHKNILDLGLNKIVVFDSSKKMIYSNCNHLQSEYGFILSKLPSYIDSVVEKNEVKFVYKKSENMWKISGFKLSNSENFDLVFSLNRIVESAIFDGKSFKYTNYNENLCKKYASNYGNLESMAFLNAKIEKYSKIACPVLICGEVGTGKDTVIYTIHKKCSKNIPLFTICCDTIKEKEFQYLINNENSPFFEIGICIYFKNIHLLKEKWQHSLYEAIDNTYLFNRNKVLFSTEHLDFENSYFIKKLLNSDIYDVATLILPTLFERIDDIKSLSSLYINEINLELGKETIGIKDDSIKLFTNFNWTYNLDQLKNVLRQLCILTETPYISFENTKIILEQESKKQANINCMKTENSLFTTGTLEEIELKIIKNVFEDEGQNHSNAAKRLGISRSTLWRKLKEIPIK